MTAHHQPTTMQAAGPAVTPAEFLLTCGVIAECGHRLQATTTTCTVARWTYTEWVSAAEVRGFTDRRRLRDAMRAGRSTPRGLRLAAAVVERFNPAELQILLDRATRRDAAITTPSLAALLALRNSPTFTLGPKRLDAAT